MDPLSPTGTNGKVTEAACWQPEVHGRPPVLLLSSWIALTLQESCLCPKRRGHTLSRCGSQIMFLWIGASECWAEGVLLLKLNNSSLSPNFAENLMGDIFFVWYLFFCRTSFNLCYLLSPFFHWAFTKNKVGEQIADLKAYKLWSCRVWWPTASRWTCWSCVHGCQDVVKYIWVAQCCLEVLRFGFQFWASKPLENFCPAACRDGFTL